MKTLRTTAFRPSRMAMRKLALATLLAACAGTLGVPASAQPGPAVAAALELKSSP